MSVITRYACIECIYMCVHSIYMYLHVPHLSYGHTRPFKCMRRSLIHSVDRSVFLLILITSSFSSACGVRERVSTVHVCCGFPRENLQDVHFGPRAKVLIFSRPANLLSLYACNAVCECTYVMFVEGLRGGVADNVNYPK